MSSKYTFLYKLIVVFILCGFVLPIKAQLNNQGVLQMDKSPEDVVIYDPDSDSYLYYHKGEEKAKPYKVISREDYTKESINQSMLNNWLKKREEASSLTERGRGIFGPIRTRIDNAVVGEVFGGNDVSIDFNGRVEVMFGIKSTKIDNPLTPPKYRRTTTPDFRTNYQLNLTGSLGTRIKFHFLFDPNATFNFDTDLKLGYNGDEDQILQLVEIGNITMPLNSTLITGSQSLFGGKVGLRFGKLDVTLVASQQKGQTKTMDIRGGAQAREFDIRADSYDVNRHFFLSQYFRDNYEKALSQGSMVVSGINITRMEVWVTNRVNTPDNSRDIVGFADLGEPQRIFNKVPAFAATGVPYPSNGANGMYRSLTSTYDMRNFANILGQLQPLEGQNFRSGQDFEKLGRARRLNPQEYFFHPQLGYLSLNMPLNNDEILAVSYEYTLNGEVFQVGELSVDGVTEAENTLIVKLLKGTILAPGLPTWDLMMKNIYRLDAYQLSEKGFLLDVMYLDNALGAAVPYISSGPIAKQPLLSVMNLDQLNIQRDPYPDGVFDFMEGITVNRQKALIIFPVLEPFGSHLKRRFKGDPAAADYVFQELYDSTQVRAQQVMNRNRFYLRGSYETSTQNEIQLNANNIPEGSVVVTAGGARLLENIDYQVNYMAGTVTIINQGFLESGIPISITVENRETFSLQTKTILGANLDYKFNKNFRLGGTILHLNEKPMTQKVAYGEDPVSNTIWGLNTNYSNESRMLTNLVNKIPFIETKAKSAFSFDAEVANLIAGQPSGMRGKLYVDDFEGAKVSLDLKNYLAWSLSSVPQGLPDLFPNLTPQDTLSMGYGRAKLAWNWIDPELLRKNAPGYMKSNPGRFLENHWVREIPVNELFPEREIPIGTSGFIQTLNLNYYPRERGPYNYDPRGVDPKGFLVEPEKRWGGIMRSMPVTDFETANYDHIEFWVMDPFVYNKDKKAKGTLYFNLGTVSEDVLRDGHQAFEQGIPYPFDITRVIKTPWGYVPLNPPLVNTFDNDATSRAARDVGLDGLNSEQEASFFSNFLNEVQIIITDPAARDKLRFDPSSDNFVYYRSDVYDQRQATILERYKDFNNMEGNSTPSGTGENSQIYTNNPDMEDINKDNTMEESESYFQYKLEFTQNMRVGDGFITDVKDTTINFENNGPQNCRWYQVKIPLSAYERTVGPINNFKSIRFMRMFLKDFSDTAVLRFATFELVRNEWRKYDKSLVQGQEGITVPESPNTILEVSVANLEENSMSTPVNYVMPPGVERVIDPSTYQERQLNEQAMQLTVRDLSDGDGRAVFKNMNLDFRQYRRLQMDIHTHALRSGELADNEISVFVRMGSDLNTNYYEYEIPLKVTPHGFYTDNDRHIVWPEQNRLDVDLSQFTDVKLFRNTGMREQGGSPATMYEQILENGHTVRVRGNPTLGEIRTMMIGVRNPVHKEDINQLGIPKSAAVWVNELRLSDFENRGGWAAVAHTGVHLADFANVSLTGSMMTAGFGGLEQRQAERSQEDVYRYDLLTDFQLGKFFAPKLGLQIPLFFGISERFALPLYDPLTTDVFYKDAMNSLQYKAERDSLRNIAMDYTRRKSINITNMRMAPEGAKRGILSIANLSLTLAYNETFAHNTRLERDFYKETRFQINYGFNLAPKYIEPFKKIGFLKSDWFALIRDFNFNPVISQFNFSNDFHRTYHERQNRNIAFPEAQLPATFAKDFTWSRHYNLGWNLAKSLTFNYAASNVARIDEPEGMVDRGRDREGYKHWRDSVWSNIVNLGRTVHFNQNFTFNWTAPFNKLKLVDWISGSGSYSAKYNWDAAPLMRENEFGYVFVPGNTIANGRNQSGNLTFNLLNLYNKSKTLKDINDQFDGRKRNLATETVNFDSKRMGFKAKSRKTITHGLKSTNVTVRVLDATGRGIRAKTETNGPNKVYVTLDEDINDVVVKVTAKVPKKEPASSTALRGGVRFLMMARSFDVSYSQDESSMLTGFMGTPRFFGLGNHNSRTAPGLHFVMGGQASDFAQRARMYGWLTSDTAMTTPFVMRKSTRLNLRMRLDPIRDLQIILTGTRSKTHDMTSFNITQGDGLTQYTGGFEITTITIGTAFERSTPSDGYRSASFEQFSRNRMVISERLSNARAERSGGNYQPNGDGYSGSAQDVLIPAFYAAYTGRSASGVGLSDFRNIPLPNWQVIYNGLMRNELFKQWFKTGRISHGYTSIYSVNAFSSNAAYRPGDDGMNWTRNQLGDFVSENSILNVSIRESFNPLFGLELGWKNELTTNFRINKNRTLGLSMANLQVLELRNTEYSVELGYFFRKVPLIFKFGENRQRKVDTDLRLTGRFSIGDQRNYIRSLEPTDQDQGRGVQISSGNKIRKLGLAADYSLIENLVMLRLFYDYDFTRPYTSTITTSNTNFGFSFSFSLR